MKPTDAKLPGFPQTGAPEGPEASTQRTAGGFMEAYRAHYASEQRRLRYVTLRRAADLALGEHAADWFRALGVGVDDEYARVLGSDAALLSRMKTLADAYRLRTDGPNTAA